MDNSQLIVDLANLSGIELKATIDEKVSLLKSMGILEPNFDFHTADRELQRQNEEKLTALVKEKEDAWFINIVHHIPILRENRINHVSISLPENVKKLKWSFYEHEKISNHYKGEASVEDDERKNYEGVVNVDELKKEDCDRAQGEVDGVKYQKYKFYFPFDINLGYHTINFEYEDANGNIVSQTSSLIAAPEKCYDGLGIDEGKKTWGVPVQLYEIKSENNLGIGNFSDLAQLGYITGKNGAGMLGVSPLHASRDSQPEIASPYEPDSRMFFNYIHLDVTAVDEFKNNPDIIAYYNSPEVRERIERNKRRALIDYTTTQEIVDDIMHRCFEKFDADHHTIDYDRFRVFCDDKDGILDMYATFCALNKHFSEQSPRPTDWRSWPEEYKNPNSPTVLDFRIKHQKEIDYYKYTQWQCEKQLAKVQEICHNSGMKIGLYMDMAVGTSLKGFEAWYFPDLYFKGTAGAKPDELSINGQKWWVLAFNPAKLQEQGYMPYRRILEANMQYAGCLRIDHVLQLNRLFIFPEGEKKGNYVYYNSDELMALVALESHRHKTMIIGEDLGETSQEYRDRMKDFGIISYKVLPFERKGDVWNSMVRPDEYEQCAVCSPSTHDTPTLVNQWNVQHIYQQRHLGIIDNKQADKLFDQYAGQRQALNWALGTEGCWEEVGGQPSLNPREDANFVPQKYVEASVAYLAKSRSALMMIPFSDIFGSVEMGNIPGTTEMEWSSQEPLLEIREGSAYPNWRRKMRIPVEHIEKTDKFNEIVGILNKYRSDGNDGRGRYYQFERMGLDNDSTLDFERAKKLYAIIRNKEAYQQEQLMKNRYSDRYKQYMEKRRSTTQNRYNAEVIQWLNRKSR